MMADDPAQIWMNRVLCPIFAGCWYHGHICVSGWL